MALVKQKKVTEDRKKINGLDGLDKDIIQLLIKGMDNRHIATKLRCPLSTVQRRARKLFEQQLIINTIDLNYEKLGYKRGLLHLYLHDGLANEIGKILAAKPGILSVSVHIGNSDLVAFFIYKGSKQLLGIITQCKRIDGVEKVLWSEEIYSIEMNEDKFNMLYND